MAHHKLTPVRYYEQEGHILFLLFSVAIHVVGSALFCHTQSCTECGGSVGFHCYCKLHFHSLPLKTTTLFLFSERKLLVFWPSQTHTLTIVNGFSVVESFWV